MTEKLHARLSPSGAERWATCPGSVALEADFPDTSSEHADWGTAAHAVSEMILRTTDMANGPTAQDAAAYKGRRIDVGGCKTVEVDDEMVETVNTYVRNILARIEALYAAGARSVEMHIEVAVPIDHITGEAGATGTADCVLIADMGDYLHIDVNDLKGGRGVAVPAIGNKQLAMYASGAMEHFSLLGEFGSVACVIHQPRVQAEPLVWEPDMLEFNGLIAELTEAAKRASLYVDSTTPLVNSDLQPSDKACRFCKAAATCPAREQRVRNVIADDFVDLDADLGPVLDAAHQRIQNCDDAHLDSLYPHLDAIENWVKAVRARIEARAFEGATFTTCKLVDGRKGARKWTDEQQAEQVLKAMRLKQEQMYDFKLISPTTAEKLAKAGDIGPRQWPKLQGLITQAKGSPSIAPITDSRPALVVTPVADEFEVVAEPSAEELIG